MGKGMPQYGVTNTEQHLYAFTLMNTVCCRVDSIVHTIINTRDHYTFQHS